jgi:uncharacterized membrane protein
MILRRNKMESIKEKKLFKPETVFIILSSLFGLIILLVTPPFQVPDEYLHFDYSYAVSLGNFFGDTSVIPNSLQQLMDATNSLPSHPEVKISFDKLLQFIRIPLNPGETVPKIYSPEAKYDPVPYLPTALSIVIARVFNFNPLDLFYFGRIINLLFWILLGYNAIKLMPDFKWAFLLLILAPMSLFEAGSYSADVFLNSISFLWISLCFNYSSLQNEEVLDKRSRILLIIIASLLSLAKPPYIFLVGLYFWIPRSKFGNNPQYRKNTLQIIGISFFLFLFSLSYLRHDLSVTNIDTTYSFMGQLRFLINSPLKYPVIVLQSIKELFIPYWYSSIGLLGWLDTLLPSYIYITYPMVVIFICIIDQQMQVLFSLKQKLITILVSTFVFLTITLSSYLTWTPVGKNIIEGLQGRYLIPVFPILILLFKNRYISVSKEWKNILVTVYLIIVLCITVRALILRYYIV